MSSTSSEARAFIVMQAIGGVGNLAMLLTALFSVHVSRHSTWLNFCITWVIFCLSYLLLVITGQQKTVHGPPFALCLTQAALIYGAPVLTSASSLALITNVWLLLRAKSAETIVRRSSLMQLLLLLLPYGGWFGVIIGAIIVGTLHPVLVEESVFGVYCVIESGWPNLITSILVVIMLVTAMVFDGLIIKKIYDEWGTSKQSNYSGHPYLSLVVRIGVFVLVSIVATFIIVGREVDNINQNILITNLYISLMPVVAFCVFATQQDILRVWTFRKEPGSS